MKDVLWWIKLVLLRGNSPYVAYRIIHVANITQTGFGFIDRRRSRYTMEVMA